MTALERLAGDPQPRKVLFVFDRVAHYHKDLFQALDTELPKHGLELLLLSGQVASTAKGRIGLKEKVIPQEEKYRLYEYHLGKFILRRHTGVTVRLRECSPDIVVTLSHVGNISCWNLFRLKRRLGFQLVAWQCGYEYNESRGKDRLLRRFLALFDLHLAYHSNARRYALDHGVPANKIVVIHNTIDERGISLTPKTEAVRKVEAVHPRVVGKRLVLFVGAVLQEKNIEVILEALDLLQLPELALMVVGDGDHLPTLLARYGSRPDVVFAGAVFEGVGAYFDAADVYVLPGTGGLGINEAMAHSLPVISGFADGSADDLVLDGQTGYRLHLGTASELAEKLALVFDHPQLARDMGRRGRDLMTGPLSFEQFVNRVVTALAGIDQVPRAIAADLAKKGSAS